MNRPDFQVDPRLLRRGLLDNGYQELPITSAHAVFVDSLPALHKDPFDRILIEKPKGHSMPVLANLLHLGKA